MLRGHLCLLFVAAPLRALQARRSRESLAFVRKLIRQRKEDLGASGALLVQPPVQGAPASGHPQGGREEGDAIKSRLVLFDTTAPQWRCAGSIQYFVKECGATFMCLEG